MSAQAEAVRLGGEYEEFFLSRFFAGRWGWESHSTRDLIPGVYTGPEWEAHMAATSEDFRQRIVWTERYSWAVPCTDVIKRIAEMSPIVEMAAGTGYWAHLLSQAGASVVAYDKAPIRNPWTSGAHFPVARGIPSRLRRLDAYGKPVYRDHTLLISWPYMDSTLSDTLLAFPGRRVVVIGEGPGGCTGDDYGHRLLGRETWNDEAEDYCVPREAQWRSVEMLDIPQWPGMHDYVEIFERRS